MSKDIAGEGGRYVWVTDAGPGRAGGSIGFVGGGAQAVDLDARLAAVEAKLDRVLKLLEDAERRNWSGVWEVRCE